MIEESKEIRSHRLLKEISESVEESIYITDTEGRFEWVSKNKAKNWGVTYQEMIGKTDFDFMTFEEAKRSWTDSQRVMTTGIPIKNKVEKITKKDYIFVHYSVSKYPRFEGGKIIGMIGISKDVTFIVNFLRTANHDIHDPIQSIGVIIKLLIRGLYGQIDESAKNTLLDVSAKIIKLEKFVEGYISDSMLENYELPEKEELDLRADIIDPVIAEFITEIEIKNIHLDNKFGLIPSGEIIMASSNRQYLTIILRNIFQNFLRFTPDDGLIAIGYEKNETQLKIIFWNSGPPVPSDKHEVIFLQGESTDSTGIGLPMCRDLARKLTGDLWYEDRDNHPTFVLAIPL